MLIKAIISPQGIVKLKINNNNKVIYVCLTLYSLFNVFLPDLILKIASYHTASYYFIIVKNFIFQEWHALFNKLKCSAHGVMVKEL